MTSFREYLGLYLNADRAMFRQANAVALGVQAATGGESLPPGWGDALACVPEEGAEIQFQADAARRAAKAADKYRGPLS